MEANSNKIPADKYDWLVTTAWKKMTVNQIADHLSVDINEVYKLYRIYHIECVSHRDIIASKLIDLYNNETCRLWTIKEISRYLSCTSKLVRDIVDEYGLNIKPRKKVTCQPFLKAKAAKEKQDEIKRELINKQRARFTTYTQSGSELTDQVRQINTTIRPQTYLTNVNIESSS